MSRQTPYSKGWDDFMDGRYFGSIPSHYKRVARVQWCRGWKAAKAISAVREI